MHSYGWSRLTKRTLFDMYFGHFYDLSTRKFDFVSLLHLFIRAAMFFVMAWVLIKASYFSSMAHINFGIVTSCTCIAIVLSSILTFMFFGERLTINMIIGIAVIIAGIVWIAIAKGAVVTSDDTE